MKKFSLKIATVLFAFAAITKVSAQGITDGFESLTLDSGAIMNGSKGETKYSTPGVGIGNPFVVDFPIFYDTSWGGYWASGWAISKKIDGSTGASDFSKHLFCAKPGFGSEKNAQGKYVGKTFAVGMNGTHLASNAKSGEAIYSLKITNSTYAYNSMKNGDAFAKKFGGITGNDADSFVLKISFFVDTLKVKTKRVVLADYRFADNSKDYILDSWQIVNFPTYFNQGPCDSIVFELESSDNGQFGMNTPGFFCVDELSMARMGNTKAIVKTTATVFPNPAIENATVKTSAQPQSVEITNTAGAQVNCSYKLLNGEVLLNTSGLAVGVYTAKVITAKGVESVSFVKK